MKKLLFVILFPFTTYSQPCNTLPKHYPNWETAIRTVAHSQYKTKEFIDCSKKSSWIKSAYFYSCDSVVGYMIVSTKNKTSYLHKGIPFSTWNQFIKANSYGSFYNRFIKHKYQFSIN